MGHYRSEMVDPEDDAREAREKQRRTDESAKEDSKID